ncbi:hypothetical protein C8P68_11221 [Mucilaginibacter yixingensis]|uniref:Uncharacterized protein n=1 Tax=Mucilaginibacter yixingensis TaxID=1295612 RepID=A0A2T5J4I7_9SPHI|nr:hypothetical protein [Mucilaginibacter yixingensis]PTQ92421.1 hypothetical protein C8P68_11221 [Mucilaginibacter yixingensis]
MKRPIVILWLLLMPGVLCAQPLIQADEAGLMRQLFDSVSGWLICLSLTLAIIAICLQLFRSPRARTSQRNDSGAELRQLQKEIMRLQNKLDDRPTINDLNGLAERIKLVEGKYIERDSYSREISWERDDIQRTIAGERSTTPEKTETTIVSDQPLSQQGAFYAKMADLENGFSSKIITRHQDGEQLFEIFEQEDRAIYKITNDIDAQRYALAEPGMLSRACELLNQPFKGCRIEMKKEGILTKAGDQWHIQLKAKIEFK